MGDTGFKLLLVQALGCDQRYGFGLDSKLPETFG
jgi:hypothetical protein